MRRFFKGCSSIRHLIEAFDSFQRPESQAIIKVHQHKDSKSAFKFMKHISTPFFPHVLVICSQILVQWQYHIKSVLLNQILICSKSVFRN